MTRTTALFAAALALAGSAGLGAGGAAAASTDGKTMDLKGLTCQQLLDVDSELQPRIVYWLDGVTQGGNAVYEVQTDWMSAPVANVVTECQRAPERAASEVVQEQRQSYSQ